MEKVLEYKGYTTMIQYSDADHVWYGKIESISDLVNFEAENIEDADGAFREAVDDYLAFCDDLGMPPNTPA